MHRVLISKTYLYLVLTEVGLVLNINIQPIILDIFFLFYFLPLNLFYHMHYLFMIEFYSILVLTILTTQHCTHKKLSSDNTTLQYYKTTVVRQI